MSQRAWERLGYAALAVMTFICTLIVVRWAIDFIAWGALDSGWAQAVGAFVAIVGTWAATRQQMLHAERVRSAEYVRVELEMQEIAYGLANDAFRGVLSIFLKFEQAYEAESHPKIGTERLVDLQESLRIFASKDISPALYAEVLIIQREIAYTITAVIQHQEGLRVDSKRLRKASNRLRPIIESALRI